MVRKNSEGLAHAGIFELDLRRADNHGGMSLSAILLLLLGLREEEGVDELGEGEGDDVHAGGHHMDLDGRGGRARPSNDRKTATVDFPATVCSPPENALMRTECEWDGFSHLFGTCL